jgi:hypothetical protein
MKALRTILPAMAMLALTSAAGAFETLDHYKAPDIEEMPPWWPILYMIVFVLGIAVVGFKSSKRTHLD